VSDDEVMDVALITTKDFVHRWDQKIVNYYIIYVEKGDDYVQQMIHFAFVT
jgi:hypothetical protein